MQKNHNDDTEIDIEAEIDTRECWLETERFVSIHAESVGLIGATDYYRRDQTLAFPEYLEEITTRIYRNFEELDYVSRNPKIDNDELTNRLEQEKNNAFALINQLTEDLFLQSQAIKNR